ncbi:MAG: hypothetical protein GY862_27590 [Gammaproteobacteria bacterium]|nr:hypothetical protein [Gammaproteobacteria bacterium]
MPAFCFSVLISGIIKQQFDILNTFYLLVNRLDPFVPQDLAIIVAVFAV